VQRGSARLRILRIDLGAFREQHRGGITVAFLGGFVERRRTLVVASMDLGAVRNEQLRQRSVSAISRQVQRGFSGSIGGADIGAVLEQQLCYLALVLDDGIVQRRRAGL